MTDQYRRDIAGFRQTHELRRAFADLTHRSRRRLEILAVKRLNRIDHQDAGRLSLKPGNDVLYAGLGKQLHRRRSDAQTPCTQRNLIQRLLARHIAGRLPSGDFSQGAQQQRGFSDPGIAADQNNRARHEPPAEHAIEFRKTRARTLDLINRHAIEPGQFTLTGKLRSLRPIHSLHRLHERIPGAAIRALPLPFRLPGSARAAAVDTFGSRHTNRE
jgi:hypothetical protein